MKIKNLLMQMFIISPLTTIMGVCTFCVVMPFLSIGVSIWEEMNVGAVIFMIILMFALAIGISKILLKIKGKAVEVTYWDSNFEYEVRHEYDNQYSLHKTKGGLTTSTKFSVILYAICAPILIVTRFIAIIFAFVSLGRNSRIFSYYGGINYYDAGLKLIPLQKMLHFLFDFVIIL